MVQILSWVLAMVFAVALIIAGNGASWATTLIAPQRSSIPITAGWPSHDCGTFRILAPEETVLRRSGRFGGALIDRRFTLTYTVGDVRDRDLAKDGQDYREVSITAGGLPGVQRTAEFPGTAEPYFLQLYVPHAVKGRHGRWLFLEIHGWFADRDRRWLGEHIVNSVDFKPAFDLQVPPPRPHPPLPTFAVETP